MAFTHTYTHTTMCDAATHTFISRLVKEIHYKRATGNTGNFKIAWRTFLLRTISVHVYGCLLNLKAIIRGCLLR